MAPDFGYFVSLVLLEPVPVASWMPVYHLLHGLSSLIGVAMWFQARRARGR